MKTILHGDCIDKIKELPENSIDAIVTDPPYELGFMGKSWDNTGIANNVELWKECLRVLKPGGHLLAFSGSRTHHRMMVAIEDSGFDIRDTIVWAFGQGFPKSLNVAKQIQKKLLLKPDDICSCGQKQKHTVQDFQVDCQDRYRSCDEQPLAVQGSDLNVSPLRADVHEHIRVCHNEGVPFWQSNDNDHFQKDKHHLSNDDFSHEVQDQLKDSQVSDNVQSDKPLSKLNERLMVERKNVSGKLDKQHLGDDLVFSYKNKLNIINTVYRNLPQCQACKRIILPDGVGTALKPALEFICMARKPLEKGLTVAENCLKWGTGGINIDGSRVDVADGEKEKYLYADHLEGNSNPTVPIVPSNYKRGGGSELGRFPANLIHDNSEQVRECFPETKSGGGNKSNRNSISNFGGGADYDDVRDSDSGNASRFFKSIIYQAKASKSERNRGCEGLEEKKINERKEGGKSLVEVSGASAKNNHPTVKPIALMEYLIKMVTPKNGVVLDPFAGSGTTGVACKNLGYDYVLIEKESEYIEIIQARLLSNE